MLDRHELGATGYALTFPLGFLALLCLPLLALDRDWPFQLLSGLLCAMLACLAAMMFDTILDGDRTCNQHTADRDAAAGRKE